MTTDPSEEAQKGKVELRDRFRMDVAGAVSFFGGFKEWGDRLETHGMSRPIYNNYRGWRDRNHIAPHWLYSMVRLNALEGGTFNLNDYIMDPISKAMAPVAKPPEAVIAKRDTAPASEGVDYPPASQPVPPVAQTRMMRHRE